MKQSALLINGILLLVAFLWGVGFVPQRMGLEFMEPMAFNAWRFGFGAITLLPVLYFTRCRLSEILNLKVIFASLILGGLLCAGAGFQQISLGLTTVANVAFITGFYVIFVPVIGLFLNHKYSLVTWIGGSIALVGLGLLSGFQGSDFLVGEGLFGDGLALLGALFWALQLLAITYFVARFNQYVLAFNQFVFCALFSLVGNQAFETRLLASDDEGYFWALLNGVIVVGVAYTLQVVALKKADPFVASVIFSLESVFGAIVGYFFFQEVLGFYGVIGAILMLIGCVLAQVPEKGESETSQVNN